MKLAINQPYFSPYSGYFSLINAADIFVVYDCVQFMRRGRIHRSQIHQSSKFSEGWMTLPIEKAPQETCITKIILKPLANTDWPASHASLLKHIEDDFDSKKYQIAENSLSDFLFDHLTSAARRLNISTKIVRSSHYQLGDLSGQDRILELCRQLGATDYINLPGGRDLYNVSDFKTQNIDLHFLETSGYSRFGYLQSRAENELERFKAESLSDLIRG